MSEYVYAPDNKVQFITVFTIVILFLLFAFHVCIGGLFWARAHFSRIHRPRLHSQFDPEKSIRSPWSSPTPRSVNSSSSVHGGCSCGSSHGPAESTTSHASPSYSAQPRTSQTQNQTRIQNNQPAPAYSRVSVPPPPPPPKTPTTITNSRNPYNNNHVQASNNVSTNPFDDKNDIRVSTVSTVSIAPVPVPRPLDVIRKSVRNVSISVKPVPEEDLTPETSPKRSGFV